MADNNDEWIASVANYIRFEFGTPTGSPPAGVGGQTSPKRVATATVPSSVSAMPIRGPGGSRRTLPMIKPDEVAKLRQETATRTSPWTLDELGPGQ